MMVLLRRRVGESKDGEKRRCNFYIWLSCAWDKKLNFGLVSNKYFDLSRTSSLILFHPITTF